jgi:superfamily II DNA or RNA helicase
MLEDIKSDIELYNLLDDDKKEKFLNSISKKYIKYDGLIDFIPKLDKNKLEDAYESIYCRITNDKELQKYISESKKYKCLYNFIVDEIKRELSELSEPIYSTDSSTTETCTTSEEDTDSDLEENDKEYIWRNNQLRGIESAINGDFCNGIHSQATGSGKSLMALHIIWQYHLKYPNNHILWICERKDIPLKLFFKKEKRKKGRKRKTFILPHKKNYDYWRKNNIIDMDNFNVMEYIFTKDKKWVEKINDYKDNKPIFLIVNRAYMTTRGKLQGNRYRYQDIIRNQPSFVIIDECHSSMAERTFNLLMHVKFNWQANIQGLSATPYRKGGKEINVDKSQLDLEEEIRAENNIRRLTEIFHKQGNKHELNILSWFNLKEAIESGVILEPIFHWFSVDKYTGKNKKERNVLFNDNEIDSSLSVLNEIIEECKYKKCLVWCRQQNIADFWYKAFNKHKAKYNNLNDVKCFIDHSGIKKNEDYDNFYEMDDNCILFCAAMHREGSDIPNLSLCMFLDRVKNRGEIPFIQCVGRVLRIDEKKWKKNGHIIDSYVEGEDKMKSIMDKILKYYLELYEISKSSLKLATDKTELNQDKVELYEQIKNSIVFNESKKKVYLKLDNDKKITLNADNLEISSSEWSKAIPKFEQVLKETIILSDRDDYEQFRNKCRDRNIQDKHEYSKNWKKYNLYFINSKNNIEKIEPNIKWSHYWKNWYDFLGIDTSEFIQTKDEWVRFCKKKNVKSVDEYYKLCSKYKKLPTMPEELYCNFSNFNNELGFNKVLFL